MDNRFSIEHALRPSNSGTPVPPPADPAVPAPEPEPYTIRIPGRHDSPEVQVDPTGTMTPVPVTTNKYEIEGGGGKPTKQGRSNSPSSNTTGTNGLGSARVPWFPPYLKATAYGERFRNLIHSDKPQPQRREKPAVASHKTGAHLPHVVPSRSIAVKRENGVESGVSSTTKEEASHKSRLERMILPNLWRAKDRSGVNESELGCRISISADPKSDEKHCCALKADRSIPAVCGVYYYETEILENGANDCISIGMCDAEAPLNKMPGQESPSWGYHGDDGRIMACQGTSKDYGPKFGAGDIIGCGVNFRKNCIFYTKNGLFLGTAFRDVSGQLYPAIGLRDGQSIRTNFGHRDFRFDIEKYVRDEKMAVLSQIKETTQSPAAMEDEDPSQFIQELVASYFSHVGFLESAKEFERECNGSEEQAAGNAMDIDEDDDDRTQHTHNEGVERQRIRELILEGNIDMALDRLEHSFPSVLTNNDLIHFKLRCRKFVELFRLSLQDENDDDRLGEVIQYGEELRRDYKDDPRAYVGETLKTIFSLYAYPDATTIANDPAVSQLFDQNQLAPLADEVNSEILVSQGKPSVPSLQRLAQHTTQLAWELSDRGIQNANFINVKDDFLL
ncbi:hypothetical protein TRICI_000997 [Trichomonascus ciferrii]|uniref:Protein SSH4 n=1 Tax=Trichomonascus ciferrii TaxID=44093 RepID=A0A642VAK6_9ASCO|nr:hypothetical protein TRICI_000997 [Trichomonascus ciferrii]